MKGPDPPDQGLSVCCRIWSALFAISAGEDHDKLDQLQQGD